MKINKSDSWLTKNNFERGIINKLNDININKED